MLFNKFFKQHKKEVQSVQSSNIIESTPEPNANKHIEEDLKRRPALDSIIEDIEAKKDSSDSTEETDDVKGPRELTDNGEKPRTNLKCKTKHIDELSH